MRFISYAQNFEDVMLWRALSDVQNGFYIDVGAADPVDMSVTQAFYERQWRGINIEPAQHYFSQLDAARPGDINLSVALGRVPGTRTFHEINGSGLSTLDARIAEEHHGAGWTVEQREVESTTLAEICRRFAPREIHFLKIDVEGAEEEVLAGGDFLSFRPWIVLLEATKPLTTDAAVEWEPVILAADYVFVWFDGLNRFYVSREHYDRLKQHFQLPPNSFDNFDKYDFKIQTWRAQQQEERQLRQDVERQLNGRLNEVKLLEEERRLRQRRQQQAAAELVELRQSLEEARQASGVQQRLRAEAHERLLAAEQALEHAESQGRYHWEILHRLAFELRWEDGPRALRLVLPLARLARKLFAKKRPTMLVTTVDSALLVPSAELSTTSMAVATLPIAAVPAWRVSGASLRRAVHQFHPGSSFGDAVTNSMLLTQKILRGLGYRSDIYVQYRDEMLADQLLLLDDLPEHENYILIVQHSLGYYQTERLAALPAPKILMYHNITPANFLRSIPEVARLADIGRAQLDFWRPRVAAALAVSRYNALELRQHNYESVVVCPLLFDVDALRVRANPGKGRFAEDPFTVLFVGRIVENKGQLELVDAFDAFRRRFKGHCQLVMVGRFEGGGEDYLEAVFERIGAHGLRQMVQITGQVSDDELHSWYDRADLYVSLSQHEGFGVPLIEAMAHDLPVIAYAAGGVPFTMSAQGYDANSILFSREAAAVADVMVAVASDADLRSEMIRENRGNLDRFRLAHHIPALVQALLLAGAEPPMDTKIRRELSPHLNFTITGHFNGTYSLAAVNRSLALALAREHPAHVRIQPIETVPTSYLGGVPAAELAGLQRLMAPMPGTGPLVAISQHYPLYVPPIGSAHPDILAAYFFWEESLVSASTIALLNSAFHAVFAPSRFVAKALLDSGLCIPVRVVGYAPPLSSFAMLGDARPPSCYKEKAFTFLHVSSAFPRKGVDVLLNAFARAFANTNGDRPVRLIIKTFPNPHNETSQQIARLRQVHHNLPEIVLIENDMDQDELLALYGEADAAVLPTRGEGFNIPAAEAVAAGLPLIVTGAGGHMDFLTEHDAHFLPFQAQHSRSHLQAGSSLWFEPDETALVASLRSLFDERASDGTMQTRAATAREAVLHRLSNAEWAGRVADATVDILLMPRARPLCFAWISSWDVRCGVAEYTRNYLSIFQALVSPGDRLAILCDDRTAPLEDGMLKVLPSWHGTDPDLNRLAATVSREDPDVLMIQHQPGLISWLSLAALLNDPRLRQRVLVVTLHSTLHLRELPAADREIALQALRNIARVIVHTVADVNFLYGLGLFDNVVMIPQGVLAATGPAPPARPLTTTDVPVIGCYGFLLPPKGLGQLISALPLLQKTWPKLRLRLINALHDAPESLAERRACQVLAESLGITSSIDWFTDFLPHERSLELLSGCDLVVLPYQRTNESSSAALRSCLSSGAPIAVSSIPIFDEAEDAISRLDARTPAGIATSVAALLTNPSSRQDLQDAGLKWIQSRSWSEIVRQVHGMVTGLIVNQAWDQRHEFAETTPPAIRSEASYSELQTKEFAD